MREKARPPDTAFVCLGDPTHSVADYLHADLH